MPRPRVGGPAPGAPPFAGEDPADGEEREAGGRQEAQGFHVVSPIPTTIPSGPVARSDLATPGTVPPAPGIADAWEGWTDPGRPGPDVAR